MKDTNHLLSLTEMETELRMRAYKDDAFRQALHSDPRTTLEREYPQWFPDGKLPESFSIRIIEEEEHSLTLVLPPRRPEAHTFVSEDNLAEAHGGGVLSLLKNLKATRKEGATSACNSAAMCGATVTCISEACNITVRGCRR